MKVGRWEYADWEEYVDEKLEYSKPEYHPEYKEENEDDFDEDDMED